MGDSDKYLDVRVPSLEETIFSNSVFRLANNLEKNLSRSGLTIANPLSWTAEQIHLMNTTIVKFGINAGFNESEMKSLGETIQYCINPVNKSDGSLRLIIQYLVGIYARDKPAYESRIIGGYVSADGTIHPLMRPDSISF